MGYLRIALALIIMASHLAPIGNEWGGTSLAGFYLLSGYSITARGTGGDFWVGRLLRLWPSYLAIAGITNWALFLGWLPPDSSYIGVLYGWDSFWQWFMVVPKWPYPSLVPAAWMLKWILLGYLLMWAGATKAPRRSSIWLLLSLLASVFWLIRTQDFNHYYQGPLLASIATSAGAACYHLGLVAPRDGQWAAFAGAISYPVFLAHYGIGAAMTSVTGLSPGWPLFWASMPPTIAVSIALVIFVERPIARYRHSRRPTP